MFLKYKKQKEEITMKMLGLICFSLVATSLFGQQQPLKTSNSINLFTNSSTILINCSSCSGSIHVLACTVTTAVTSAGSNGMQYSVEIDGNSGNEVPIYAPYASTWSSTIQPFAHGTGANVGDGFELPFNGVVYTSALYFDVTTGYGTGVLQCSVSYN
jgi:hypothetical protein